MGEIFMPKMGDAMTEGRVVRWYKQEGDEVEKGEPVLEIETDKVNLDLEAEESGKLSKVFVPEGEMADVGATLAVIGDEAGGEGREARDEGKKSKKKKDEKNKEARDEGREARKEKKKEARDEGREARKEPDKSDETFVRSSPLARKIAAQSGVDIGSIRGSGPGGRVVADDVRAAAESGTAAPARVKAGPRVEMPAAKSLESKEVPLTAMRRTIALRLAESIGPVPHFFLTIEADVTRLLEARAQLNEVQPVKTSVNDFVTRAVALSLLEHPFVNASFTPEAIELHGSVDIGIAVATEEGLLTPVVRNADRLSIPGIAEQVRDLAERARNRKLKPDEYQGSTFTISNLGMFGIDEFTAIINPPNAAILAVGAAVKKPVVLDDEIVIRDRMRMTMSCDHRVIDGAMGAEFLQTLKKNLEQPLRLLISAGGDK